MSDTSARDQRDSAQVNMADEDEDETKEQDMPLTMAASVVLDSLPKTAKEALEGAGQLSQAKVTVRFQAVGSATQLRQKVFKISSTARFETVVNSLRKKLGLQPRDSVFCYVNSVFAPALDENVGNMWRVSQIERFSGSYERSLTSDYSASK